ncbi:glycosyltransferase, group 1 family protein [Lactobacillus delbrueckii subsp. bulgaricus PB2003/044-T3-4]|nr:glycosyltransferase, group 1 family protein [Lactobacillus delbrueckii subsp. bulgaricus PB2003/044-T3-4]
MLEKMKILLVSTNNLSDNGISTFIINNAKLLAKKKNIHVDVLAPNEVAKDIKDDLKKNEINVFEIHDRNSNPKQYFRRLISLLKHENYDVVHVNGSSNIMSIELAAAYFAGVKVRIAHSHNTVTEHERLHKLLHVPFNIFVNCRVACNEAAGKWLFNNKQFIVVDNGIFLDKYRFNTTVRAQMRKQLGLSDDDILLGHVGGFNEQKNQAFLLNVMKKLDSKYKLILVGQGGMFDQVKKQTEEMDLGDRVIFTGSVHNVPDYLSAMDVFVLPSRFEGQPFVVVEASANGLPIILSDKISRESNLTSKLEFVSLDPKAWIEAIEKADLPSRDDESDDNIKRLAAKGYDAVKNADDLYNLYAEKLKVSAQ